MFDVAGDEPSSEPVATLGFSATPAFFILHANVGGEEGNQQTRRRSDGGGEVCSERSRGL